MKKTLTKINLQQCTELLTMYYELLNNPEYKDINNSIRQAIHLIEESDKFLAVGEEWNFIFRKVTKPVVIASIKKEVIKGIDGTDVLCLFQGYYKEHPTTIIPLFSNSLLPIGFTKLIKHEEPNRV